MCPPHLHRDARQLPPVEVVHRVPKFSKEVQLMAMMMTVRTSRFQVIYPR